jgi:phosphoglycolate phosphatase-like HAD superfamily hydrolase
MRLILFDVDGTLINGGGRGRRAVEAAFADVFGLTEIPDLSRRVEFSGALDPVIFAEMAATLGIPPVAFRERAADLASRYLERLESDGPAPRGELLAGVRPLLDRLGGEPDVVLGLLTGNLRAGARLKLEGHGVDSFFPDGGFGEDGATRGEVARVAWERLQARVGRPIPPSQVFVVGDSCRDVACALENDFVILAVASGWTSAEDLAAAAPQHLLPDLAETDRVLRCLGLQDGHAGGPEGCGSA